MSETPLHASALRLALSSTFFEDNDRGLPERYNEILDARAGRDEIVVFAHDDVSLEDLFLVEKLRRGAATFAIQGLAGSASFTADANARQTTWFHAPREHLSGAVEHVMPDGRKVWSSYGPTPQKCVVLDGLFIAVDAARIGSVRFDLRFQFHFYDLDFCLSAHRAGLAIGTVNVHANHRSTGQYKSLAFFSAQRQFRAKWTDWVAENSTVAKEGSEAWRRCATPDS